ncbi:MAG TPA: HEAT repeat domain-containing protein [Candidatus Bathyarchaeia archaeon]|nr:HEAT repeat domain-containing protein [Candidatus Bathyarchaeia archaeon]
MSLQLRCAVVFALLATLAPSCAAAENAREEAWTVLKQGLNESNIEKRTKAVGDLGLLPDDHEALDAALTALKDPKPEVRTAAAQALGEMSAKSAIPQLTEALKDDDPSVILAAGRALVTLGDDSGYDVFYAVLTGQEKAGSSLLGGTKKMLDDPRKLAALGFQTGLGFVPFGGVGVSAYKFFTKDDTSPVLAAAALTLAKDPDPKSGDALANAALEQKKWLVRAAAFSAIAKRGETSLMKTAVLGLQDAQDEVQYAAAAAVIHLSDIESEHKEKTHPEKHRKHETTPQP